MLLRASEAAQLLGVSERSLSDRRFRFRLGLTATKVGRCLRFDEAELQKVIERGRERLPGEGRR